MDWNEPGKQLVTCGRGLQPYLDAELRAAGYEPTVQGDRALEIEGTAWAALALNLTSRTANHVLHQLGSFACDSSEELYQGVSEMPWERIVPADEYMSVVSRSDHASVRNSMWPNLVVKDAVVDRIADRRGRRPDSGPRKTGAVIALHWLGGQATLFADLSGVKLSDRGYRREGHKAPLRETLAAGLVLATGYDGSVPFVNPMCGSGTLAIEAALIAAGRAPGLLRSDFGAMHLCDFDHGAWQQLRERVRRSGRGSDAGAPIIASDRDRGALAAAHKNARTAGVDHLIDFHCCDFAETPVPVGEGVVLLNPEYGERLGTEKALVPVYGRIGDWFKQECTGYTGWVFTGNANLLKRVGLRTSQRLIFYNGPIECRLAAFRLYAGSLKRGDGESSAERS